MSYVLSYASRSVSRGGCSVPVRGTTKPGFLTDLIQALDFLYSKGVLVYQFHLTATTTGASETVSIARLTTYYDTTIDWGDGTAPETLVANVTTARTHVYAVAGTYPITVNHAHLITQLQIDNAKLGGLDTSELQYSVLTYFWVTLATNCKIDSADMVDWRPTTWYLFSMPAGTYSISSANMVDWRPTYWHLHTMPAGTYSISSANMVDWRPTTWYLFSMPAGTYSISSANMVDWRPTTWRLYSMPAGTYSISSANMVDWRPTYWHLFSMPAGTYSISSANMVDWRPTTWRLSSMPAAGSSYTFAASCMRAWTALTTLTMNDLGLDATTIDLVLADLYAGRMGYTAAAPTANLGGTNADPTGVYQAKVPPTTGMETKYELINDSAAQGFKKWAITT